MGYVYSSVVECLPSVFETLNSIPNTEKKKNYTVPRL